MQGLLVRKLADKSDGERIEVPILEQLELANGETVQVLTGRSKLVNPNTPGVEHEAWPSAGVRLESAPDETRLPTSFVDNAVSEGWAERVNEKLVRRPAGPADRTTASWHIFMQCDAIIFHTVDGDVRYKVVHQPDKYADDSAVDGRGAQVTENTHDSSTPVTHDIYSAGETRVDWFYGVEKEDQS